MICNNISLGKNKFDEWFDDTLENLRKNEISTIQIKKIREDKDDSTKKFQESQYYQIQLIEWTTIIDLNQDGNYMKRVLKEGLKQDRIAIGDEVTCNIMNIKIVN